MTLLLPLGLIGLISIALLVTIYLIRPNYQNRLVSTTFVWKLSMKYRKKSLPISKLRNILILICQLLLLASLAVMMAQPAIPVMTGTSKNEKIAIVDASASMMVATGNNTRFQRALDEVKALAEETYKHDDGVLSIIVAGTDAYMASTRIGADDSEETMAVIADLSTSGVCGYGSADIDGAADLAEQILNVNSRAEVVYFTDTIHSGNGSFTVKNVALDDDWNAAIMAVRPILDDTNTYTFEVDAGCFGIAKTMRITFEIYNPNGMGDQVMVTATKSEQFSDVSESKTITFESSDFAGVTGAIYSFSYIRVSIDENDSLTTDNSYYVYGSKPTINIQYSTSKTESFYTTAVNRSAVRLKNYWDIQLDRVAPANAAVTGYDMYIFEGTMPDVMPTDGIVIISDPDKTPSGASFQVSSEITNIPIDTALVGTGNGPLMQDLTFPVEDYQVTAGRYRTVLSADGYQELVELDSRPVILAKNTPDEKVILITIDLQMSTLGVSPQFYTLMYNIFNYYLPPTLQKNAYEVGEDITVNARGEDLKVTQLGGETLENFESLPATINASKPGNFSVTQTLINGELLTQNFYVCIPNAESNISAIAEPLPELYADEVVHEDYRDLIMWFAIGAIVLFAAEWILHSRENL